MAKITMTYLDHMGSDLTVVNRARVSFGTVREELTVEDRSLILYLARGVTSSEWAELRERVRSGEMFDHDAEELIWRIRNTPTHFAPFCHPQVSMRVSAPISTARQLWKSHIGVSGGDAGYAAWSEKSRRYVKTLPDMYYLTMHVKADNIKQGGSDEVCYTSTKRANDFVETCGAMYEGLLGSDIAPEDAREVLPMATMTEWDWTGSLYFWARLYMLRNGHGAQRNARDAAFLIEGIVKPLYPVSWAALTTGRLP